MNDDIDTAHIDTPEIHTPEVDAARLIAFTQDLVRIPSVYDPDRGLNEEPVADVARYERLRVITPEANDVA